MIKQKTVLMAEISDIYHDAGVQKEADSFIDAGYNVMVFGFRDVINCSDEKYNFRLITKPVLARKFRSFRKLDIMFLIFYYNLLIVFTKADYYHSHNTLFLSGMWIASRLFKSKLIYDSHEVQWELNKIAKKLEEYFIHEVDRIINVSEGRAKVQAERFSLDINRIAVISNYPRIIS